MTQTSPATKKKVSIVNTSITILGVIVLIIAGIYFGKIYLYNSKVEETNDAQVGAYINPVSARAAGYIPLFQLLKRSHTPPPIAHQKP